MRKLVSSLLVSVSVLASAAGCTAEAAPEEPEAAPEEPEAVSLDTLAPQGVGRCTIGGVVVSCTEPICALPTNSTLGSGPAIGYYSRATCEAYAAGCGKRVFAYNTLYVTSQFAHTTCYFL